MRPNYMNTVLDVYSGLEKEEKKTFLLHMGYSLADGLVTGVLTLNEFVFLKNFEPGSFKLSMLFQLAVLVLPFSIFFNHFFEKVDNKKRMLLRISMITRLPLLLFLLFPFLMQFNVPISLQQDLFLAIFLLYFFATPFTLPFINGLLKSNYRPEKLGKLYSYAISINMLTTLVSSLIFGKLLDTIPGAYLYVYPVAGVLGMAALYFIASIKTEPKTVEAESQNMIDSWRSTFMETYHILKYNKPFRDFQIGMMIYGIAFLMNLAVVALFLNNVLGLNYTEIAGYKGLASALSIISFPLFGVLLDRNDPRRFGIMSFTLCSLFFVQLILGYCFPFYFEWAGFKIYSLVLLGYMFYGFFNGSMTILWGIGSSYFSLPEDAGKYHSIHCTLTGIRGIIAPIVGTLIYYFTGFYGAFGTSLVLLLIAIWYCNRSLKIHRKVPAALLKEQEFLN